ncbi:MAG TPA: hypothetical protein VIG32_12075 [Candidatus Baltobacteraceae bacterium]
MGDVPIVAAITVAAVLAQDLFPGRELYHYGWYGALLVALVAYAALRLRRIRRARPREIGALAMLVFGTAIVAFAGAASGLLAPDTQTVLGAPGASVPNADAGGTFVFPFAAGGALAPSAGLIVHLQRPGSTIAVGGRRPAFTASSVMWQSPRTVVYVEAEDARGNRLTITQPTNGTFLSPILLMAAHTTIAGMNVPVDTFSVPAASRVVKAVLFSPEQAAQLHTNPPILGSSAVLFAVSDQNDRILPGGIGVVRAGARRNLAGLRLRADVGSYPAIVLASTPYAPALAIGLLLAVAGFGRLLAIARSAPAEPIGSAP